MTDAPLIDEGLEQKAIDGDLTAYETLRERYNGILKTYVAVYYPTDQQGNKRLQLWNKAMEDGRKYGADFLKATLQSWIRKISL